MYPELISSKQAPWNKCLILWPVCTSSKTNRPLYLWQRMRLQSQWGTMHIIYQLVYIVKQRDKRAANTRKSQSFMVLGELQWFGGSSWISVDLSLLVSIFFLADDMLSLAFLILTYSAVLLGAGLVFSLHSSICCFQNYSLCLFGTATTVIMFEMHENLNSLQIFH